MSLGEPDFPTPAAVVEAAVSALRGGMTKYLPTAGDPQTRAAIASKLETENGIRGVTGDHVVVTAGAKHAFFLACHCLLDPPRPGHEPDEVLLPTPAWVSYAPIAQLAGGRVVEVRAGTEQGLKVTADQIRRAITPRSRLLVLNSPCNPTGQVLSREELGAIAEVVNEAAKTVAPRLLVVADEIYEKIVYAGATHTSIGSLDGVAERTVTINGLSKAFAMTGWRIGYTAMPGEEGLRVARAIETLQGQMTSNITSFVMPAIVAALRLCGGETRRMAAEFAARAELVARRLAEIPSLATVPPRGAFYAFPDVWACLGRTTRGGRVLRTASDFAAALLEEERVAIVPGEEFGAERHVRISFACAPAEIERGIDGLERFVMGLRA